MLRLLLSELAIIAIIGAGNAGMAFASDVQGNVALGPTCPGPTSLGQDCPPRPIATTVDIFAFQDGGAISATPLTSVATDASGYFRLSLVPGRYWFVPRPPSPGGIEPSRPAEVIVEPAGVTTVTLHIDSGMRAPGFLGGPAKRGPEGRILTPPQQ